MEGGEHHHTGQRIADAGGEGEKRLPAVLLDLVHAGGEPGEVLPLVLGVVLPIALLQKGRRHIPPDRVVHLPHRPAMEEGQQAVQEEVAAPAEDISRHPEGKEAEVQVDNRLAHLDLDQAEACVCKAEQDLKHDGQQVGSPELFQIVRHVNSPFLSTFLPVKRDACGV